MSFRRASDGARVRERGENPSGEKPSWKTRRPWLVQQVSDEPVAEPYAPPTRVIVPEPGQDLLETLHPKPPRAPEPEPVLEQAVVQEPHHEPALEHEGDDQGQYPVEHRRNAEPEPVQRTSSLPLELQLRALLAQMHTAPALDREQLEPETDPLHGRVAARQPIERELERRPDQEPMTFIDEVRAVPEINPQGRTDLEHPPQRHRANQTSASLESCEIKLWRGFVKYQLYATYPGSEEAIAVSRYFRLRDPEAPGAGAQRALADLVAELEQGGWRVAADSTIWHQQRLPRSRRLDSTGELT